MALLARIVLFASVHFTILGADVGRFTIMSHTMFLKGEITPNLQPYDMAKGFFYFLGVFLLPLLFEYLGINSIISIVFFALLFSFLGTLVFYKIAKIFLDENQSLSAFIFYSFVFDIILIFNFFGVFPYGFATFFFLIAMWGILRLLFENKSSNILIFTGILGITLFHWYLIFPLLITFLSFMTYEFVNDGRLKKTKQLFSKILVSGIIAILVQLPLILPFLKHFGLERSPENIADLMSYTARRLYATPLDYFITIFFTSYIGTMISSIFFIGFILIIYASKNFLKNRNAFWIYFFIYLAIHSVLIFNELNLLRITSFLWLVYSIVLGYYFKNWKINLIFVLIFFFIQSPSVLYLISAINFSERVLFVPFVDFNDFSNSMEWIKNNTPLESTFLIDGGGAGCTGASASYGERIFPLTSRKIFYFTNYCYADYNRTEYMHRVDLYRRISIDPDNLETLNEIKSYGVDYVFIGNKRVGFDPKYFINSINYELVYNENDYFIFKIK